MSERLEMFARAKELKSAVEDSFEHSTNIQDGELVDWLIEQAERVEELEIELKGATDIAKSTRSLYDQNTRLREALKAISSEDEVGEGYEYADQVANNLISIAKSALESEPK